MLAALTKSIQTYAALKLDMVNPKALGVAIAKLVYSGRASEWVSLRCLLTSSNPPLRTRCTQTWSTSTSGLLPRASYGNWDVFPQTVSTAFETKLRLLESSRAVRQAHFKWTPNQVDMLSPRNPGSFGFSAPRINGEFGFRLDFDVLPHQVTVRGFGKALTLPPQMQRPTKLKLYMGSPGVIGEPYKRPPPPMPILARWFTREGWKRKQDFILGVLKTSYAIAKLRQKTKGYTQQRFYQDASILYKQINTALAQGDRSSLRHLVTDSVFSVMKNELKHRESGWARVDWEMVGPISKIRTLQGRLVGVDKNNHDNAFVQLTVRIECKQKFAAYDKLGRLVAGDLNKELLVEDFWVFEKPLLLTEAKWRLCGRLSV